MWQPVPLLLQPNFEVQNTLQSMQEVIDTSFDEIKKKLCELEGRIGQIESKQYEVLSSPGWNSTESTLDARKKRIPDLQVQLHCMCHFKRIFT